MENKRINSNAFFISSFFKIEFTILGILNSVRSPYFVMLTGDEAEEYLLKNKMQISIEDPDRIIEIK